MLDLAKVTYLLLVVTTTSALDLSPLSSAQLSSLQREKYPSTKKVLDAYENANETVGKVMSQMEFTMPYQPNCWNNERIRTQIKQDYPSEDECISDECFKLFMTLTVTKKDKMIACSRNYLEEVKIQRHRLNEVLMENLPKIVLEETRLSKRCALLQRYKFLGQVLAPLCIKMGKRKLLGLVGKAMPEISAVVQDVQKMGDVWGSDAAYCVAVGEGPDLAIQWHNACKASILSED